METVIIKQEPIDIKEEPIDPDDPLENQFDQALLVPKIEVIETDLVSSNNAISVQAEQSSTNSSLSCPKCHITYYSAMSIKNHIQVCKKDAGTYDGSIEKVFKVKPKIVIKGVKKLPDDERKSIRILEQSCFVNELNKDEGIYPIKESKILDNSHLSNSST